MYFALKLKKQDKNVYEIFLSYFCNLFYSFIKGNCSSNLNSLSSYQPYR